MHMNNHQSGNIITRNWHRFKVWYKGLYRGRPWWVKTLAALGTFIVLFLLYLIAVDINLLWLFGKSPSTYSIMHPRNPEASYLYSADGKTIGKYYDENRTPVTYESINPQFFQVLIDTEDERFYKHHGIDFSGLGAAFKDMVLHGRPRGASTITQQLVKNLFLTHEQTFGRKGEELLLALDMEASYEKDEILELYLNTIYYGSNFYSIKAASLGYFDKQPRELSLPEAAMLAGLPNAPSLYSPYVDFKMAKKRQIVVLDAMVRNGYIDEKTAEDAKIKPLYFAR